MSGVCRLKGDDGEADSGICIQTIAICTQTASICVQIKAVRIQMKIIC
jgi:hypothetical protein